MADPTSHTTAPAALWPTCVVDGLGPGVRAAAERTLAGAGIAARVPRGAGCCGQPAYNAGQRRAARRVATPTLRALDRTEGPVVVPSGSCAAMVRLHWREVFAATPHADAARRVAERTVELSEALTSQAVSGAAAPAASRRTATAAPPPTSRGAPPSGAVAVAHHASCHLTRHLGIRSEPITLLARAGYDVRSVDDGERCCGFGGTFSATHADLSVAMADEKLDALAATGAGTVSGCDLSCLVHLQARATQRGMPLRFAHLAELLADSSTDGPVHDPAAVPVTEPTTAPAPPDGVASVARAERDDARPVGMPRRFTDRARVALHDEHLGHAVRRTTDLLASRRTTALDELADPDGLRDAASAARRAAIGNLEELLGRWERQAKANGITVHHAADAVAATDIVTGIVTGSVTGSVSPGDRADPTEGRRAALVAKGKSMASEEIHLNDALSAAGHRVVETDLGELIVQLAHEPPSHIIVPAIHKDRYQVAELFTADAGQPVPPVVADEAEYARRRLRSTFHRADVGITGVNFAVAETGGICLVENEGNGRFCSTLPRVHVAIMGMERVVADWDELEVMLSLLARSATGQSLSAYTNLIHGPRRDGEANGPDEVHVVVLDNGRRRLLGSPFEEALDCIRCGACLNVCPVYRHVGGHAYGSVYPGPIGSVLTPLLQPDDAGARELAHASTLCGACTDACPVRIPLHDLLAKLRRRDAPRDTTALTRLGFALWSRLWARPYTYRFTTYLVGRIGPRLPRRLPGWAGAWRRDRQGPRRR